MPGRKRPLPTCPNPLFTRWLELWRDAAAEQGRSRARDAYQRALNSLRKYPLPLQSGREAQILQYFGDRICRQLDEELDRHRSQHGLDHPCPVPSGEQEKSRPSSKDGDDSLALQPAQCPMEPPPMKRMLRRPARKYVPARRSGAYAVLLALYRDSTIPQGQGFLTKPELQRAAQPLCDKSFSQADPGSKYTAWASVGTLIRKELLLKTNIPARYSLTEAGLVLAQELAAVEQSLGSAPDPSAPGAQEPPPLSPEEEEEEEEQGLEMVASLQPGRRELPREPAPKLGEPQIVLRPNSFDIVLCVDFTETAGGSTSRKQELASELHRNAVPFHVRKLHVGDFVWVARERVCPIPGQLQPPAPQELALGYVVERKRMADLCSSIIDGRFREQKFRLHQCGLQHPIYLVEDSSTIQHLSLPESTLQQAVINTQVVDGFFVKRTRDVRESAAYLTVMTRHLDRLFGNKTLLSCTKEEMQRLPPLVADGSSCRLLPFSEFNEGAIKNKAQTVREVFARQLMQVSGVSGDKAAAILERYSTPASLLAAYAACLSPQDKEMLLSNTKCGKLQRNLGPTLSKTLAQLYCTPGPLP